MRCILKQDIGWFDEHPTGQLPTMVTANIAKVQDGLGRKVGDIVFNGLSGEFFLLLLFHERLQGQGAVMRLANRGESADALLSGVGSMTLEWIRHDREM